jgi:hypothetical protein
MTSICGRIMTSFNKRKKKRGYGKYQRAYQR